ncbi:hypothetical protein CEXT_606241 [Caerostris extrusa]|uniref:Uncharacterized protein n=1 Tax=Caerostris extrusa TaxID=172846 RepID=A0AAV4PD41_CAEEX|nr:hypothetical protein CEXT_606241 [Caerostris extrusa]
MFGLALLSPAIRLPNSPKIYPATAMKAYHTMEPTLRENLSRAIFIAMSLNGRVASALALEDNSFTNLLQPAFLEVSSLIFRGFSDNMIYLVIFTLISCSVALKSPLLCYNSNLCKEGSKTVKVKMVNIGVARKRLYYATEKTITAIF